MITGLILAASVCVGTPDAYANLTNLGQDRQYLSVTASGEVIEFWANDDSWTMFVSMPDGTSCFVASGEVWQEFEGKPQL